MICPHCGKEIISPPCCPEYAAWGMTVPKQFGVGTMVYLDTYGGMIRCEVVWVEKITRTRARLAVKVMTRKSNVYAYGETRIASSTWVVPIECYRKTGSYTYRATPHEWVE